MIKRLLVTAFAFLSVLAVQALNTDVTPDDTGMTLSAQEWDKNVVMGWNLGNSLESGGGETGWGNPKTTQEMIKYIKSQGFNAIRIPVRWTEQLSDATNMVVKDEWLNRVKEIVDWCLAEDMYVIINTHHEAWLDRNPFKSKKAENNRKLAALWKCIATFFRDYDQRLAFAGTNETIALVNGQENWGKPESEWQEVQNSYNQTFIDAVRSTGGKNYYRHLVVQTYACNGYYGLDGGFIVPTDVVEGRLSVEFHCYDPYEYAGSGSYYYWGKKYKDMGKSVPTSDESTMRNYFLRIFYGWWKKGLGVVLGEYGATCHYKTDEKQAQLENQQYYYQCMVSTARECGFAAFVWDNNGFGNGTEKFGIFRRTSSGITIGNTYPLKGICEGANVEYKEPDNTPDDNPGGTVFWEGDSKMDWGNGLQLYIPAYEFEALGKDVRMTLQYTLDYTDYNMIQLMYGDWDQQNAVSLIIKGTTYTKEYIPSDVHAVGNGESATSVLSFPQATYDILARKGVNLQGHGIRLNKVLLSDASGIQPVTLPLQDEGPYYTIDGRRVAQPVKGVYIRNGRKVIIK